MLPIRQLDQQLGILAKAEIPETGGLNTRFTVTNLSGHPAGIDHGFYVQRGNVPERPRGELKNGLAMDRLSSPRFLANAQKLLVHVLAYLLWSLFREANAEVPELAKMEVSTARTQLFKVGALVQSTAHHVWFHLASHWPGQTLYARAATAVRAFVAELHESWRSRGWELEPRWNDPPGPLANCLRPGTAQITAARLRSGVGRSPMSPATACADRSPNHPTAAKSAQIPRE